jgi:uncharacterized protein
MPLRFILSAMKLSQKMAEDLKYKPADLIAKPELRQQINIQKYVSPEVGLPTLKDILAELARPRSRSKRKV